LNDHTETTVFGDLFKHVVVETYTGRNRDWRIIVKVDGNRDIGFFRLPPSLSLPVGMAKRINNSCPGGLSIAAKLEQKTTYTDTFCELQVGLSISDHGRRPEVDVVCGEECCQQPGTGFTTLATIIGCVWANEYLVERYTLRLK
jgi:hypothetical protein